MFGPDLRIRRFTPDAEKLLNLIPADVGRALTELKLNISVDDLDKMVLEVIDKVTTREREVQDRGGRWYLLRIRPYRTLENRIDGAVMVLYDIDDLKRTQEALRESDGRFRTLADSAPVLIWMTDLEGLAFVNRAFEDFVGEVEGEIRGASVARFIHPEERETFEQTYDAAVKSKDRLDMRARFRRADGEYRWMKVLGRPRLDVSGRRATGFVGGTFDITEMKEAEAALLELDRGKNEFLAMLAHELRNPLSGVRDASRLLDHTADEAMIAHARDIIERQTTHMVRMIDDLLDVSRITQGKIHLRFEIVDLVTIIRECIAATDIELRKHEQRLATSLPERPVWVLGDPTRLDQIVANLLVNASKFTRNGGRIWLTLEREPHPERAPHSAVLGVRDNGAGIEPAMLPRIFELFVQGRPGDRSGIGLGLTLARRLVELHGGTIEAYSAGPGMGSEFIVRLPLTDAPAKTAPSMLAGATVPTEAEVDVAARAKRILIIDDHADSADSLRMVLEQAGHDVTVIASGRGAARQAVDFRADAIVLDIGLPDIDGYEVAKELRKERALDDIVIIAVTGYGSAEDALRSHVAGIDEHMAKPVDPDRLLRRIAQGRVARKP
jgi:two-component system CheB/CheR fusion protein